MPPEYLPLTISQNWLLNESLKFKYPGWVTIEFLAKTKVRMEEWAMQESIYYLVDKYESLRVRFTATGNGWLQEVYPLSEAEPFSVYDLAGEDLNAGMKKIKEICIAERNNLLPERGNLIKVIFFKISENEGRIWFCMHHMISDYVSAITLAKEFMATYNDVINDKAKKWQTGKDYRKWLYIVDGHCRDILLPAEMKYWDSLPWEKINILPTDFPEQFPDDKTILDAVSNNTLIHSYKAMNLYLGIDETSELYRLFGAEFENVLTAVFFMAIASAKNMEWLGFDMGNSGRNILPAEYGVDVYKVPGYISIPRALFLRHPKREDPILNFNNVLKQIKSIPGGGKAFYFIRDHFQNEHLRRAQFHFKQRSLIFLNYLGRVDALTENEQFELVYEDTGLYNFTTEFRKNLLLCVAIIRDNRLYIQLDYSDVYFKKETIETMLKEMETIFHKIVSEPIIEKIM